MDVCKASGTNNDSKIKCIHGDSWRRCVALFCLFLLGFGLFFTYDIPGSLQQAIMEQFELNAYRFSFLYSIYSWPNIIMCIFSGFLIDRVFGVRLATIIYSGIAVFGLALFSLGGVLELYPLMLTGRFIFGFGGESAGVCMMTYTILWFTGKELNLVFALILNISRIGSSVVYQAAAPLYNYLTTMNSLSYSLGITLVIMSCPFLLSLTSSLLLAILKPKKENKEMLENKKSSEDVIQLKDILVFPLQFWIICFVSNTYFNTIYSFLALSQENLMAKYNVSLDSANYFISFFNVITAILSPILGLIVDNRGKNLTFVTISIITGIIAHSLIAYTMISAYIVMLFFSISFAFILSSVWPMFAMLASKNKTGTAYGVNQAVMNAWLSVGSLLAGYIVDEFNFFALELFFIISLNVCLILTVIMWTLDKKKDGLLNMSAEQRKYYEKRRQGISQMTLDRISSVSDSIGQSIGNLSTLTAPSMNSADFRL